MHLGMAIFAFILAILQPIAYSAITPYALELTPVKILVDKQDRIHVAYQENCGAEFAGFMLRPSAQKELQVGVILRRNHGRCADLKGMQELIIPQLKASQFAGVTSINTSFEPNFLKASPIQTVNHLRNKGQMALQALYTSQCGTPIGLYFQPQASGYQFGIIEGKHSKFGQCNRSSKVVAYPHLNFAGIRYNLLKSFDDDDAAPAYSIKRVDTRLVFDEKQGNYQVQYLRGCNEAPIGLIRQPFDKSQSVAMLVAHYPDMNCEASALKKFWSFWKERVSEEIGGNLAKSFYAPKAERLSLIRPTSYNAEAKDSLEVTSYVSCQKDIGIVTRADREGYAIAILRVQDSRPCNSPLKQVSFSYSWTFDQLVKREVKPLQLVGL